VSGSPGPGSLKRKRVRVPSPTRVFRTMSWALSLDEMQESSTGDLVNFVDREHDAPKECGRGR
jgi:hypothetical protein